MRTIKDHTLFSNKDGSLSLYKPLHPEKRVREILGYELDYQHFSQVLGPSLSIENGVARPFLPLAVTVKDLTCLEKEEIPSEAIRKLALFDLRVLNADRHEENLLWDNSQLILIDHAEILPEKWRHGHFCWSVWPQAKTVFSSSEIDYFFSLPLEEEYSKIKKALSSTSAQLFLLASLLIRVALAAKWNAYAISRLFAGSKKHPSPLYYLSQELSTSFDDINRLKDKVDRFFQLKWSLYALS